jgi:hypothetical protein
MIDEFAKEYLHDELRSVREALVWKLGSTRTQRPANSPSTPRAASPGGHGPR